MAETIERTNSLTLPDAAAMGYSQISVGGPGRLAVISGQVAWSRDGTPPPEGFADQVRIAGANLLGALEALGAGPADIVLLRVHLVRPEAEDWAAVGDVLRPMMGGVMPSVTGIGVFSLAAPDLRGEIEATVRTPDA